MGDTGWLLSSNVALFERLSHKLVSLVYSRTDGDKKLLEGVLSELNSIDFNVFCLKNNDNGVLVINQCCYLITPEDEQLVLMACDLFINLIMKQQVIVKGKTLSLAVSWCLQCLQHKRSIEVLRCLQVLLLGNSEQTELPLMDVLNKLKIVSNYFQMDASDPADSNILLHCLKCIENIVFPSSICEERALSSNVVDECFEIFQRILYVGRDEKITYVNHLKCIISAMKGIGNLLQTSDYVLDTYMNDILGIIKGYMLYGLPGDDGYRIEKVLPCQKAIPDIFKYNSETRKLKGKYDKKGKKIHVTSITSVEESEKVCGKNEYIGFNDRGVQQDGLSFNCSRASDSDYSEDENGQSSNPGLLESKIRHCALILLGITINKTDSKLFTAYLPNFLPDGSQVPHVRTLVTCLLKDNSPFCRAEVAGIMRLLISNSKQYFLQADNSSRTSFTTFSGTVGNIIKELHVSLALALRCSSSVTVISRILKCMCELIRCSPYRKLEKGLITRLSLCVKDFLKHKNVEVQVSALSVFGCIASVQPQTEEIREIIMKSALAKDVAVPVSSGPVAEGENMDDEYRQDAEESTVNRSWLLELCLANITGDLNDDTSVKTDLVIESLEVIGALVRNFFLEIVVSSPKNIMHILQISSIKPAYLVRLYGGKLMDTVLNSLQFSLTVEDESKRAPIPLIIQFWETLLPGPVTSLIQSDKEPMLRSTGCDCIANVGVLAHAGHLTAIQNSFIFDLLPRKLQILCITLLFGCVLDDSPVVRSSAIRAVAILVLFPSLMEDPLFFLDATDAAVESAQDENNNVRYQSAWLLGNITESIVQNHEKEFGSDVIHKVLLKLLETSIRLAEDSPKIRPGALRAIGNILRTVNNDYALINKNSVINGLNTLVKNATSGNLMKARWNSCYALANSLKNALVYKNSEHVSKIFNALTNLVQNYKNFKVRISAACALRSPPTRECYGDHYHGIWCSILYALENSKNVYDVNEYQHRDQLLDQLCFVMLHLITLIAVDDLTALEDILVHHLENVKHCMARFQESVVPERGDIFLKAAAHIRNLMDVKNLRPEHRSAVAMFENLLDSDS